MPHSVIGKVTKGAIGQVKQTLYTIKRTVKQILKVANKLYDSTVKLLGFGKEKQNQADKSLSDLADSIKDSLWDNISKAIEKNISAIWEYIKKLAFDTLYAGLAIIDSVLTTAYNLAKGVLDEIGAIFKDLTELFDAIGDEFSDLRGIIKDSEEIKTRYSIEDACNSVFKGDKANIKVGIAKGKIFEAIKKWWDNLSNVSKQQFIDSIKKVNVESEQTYKQSFIDKIEQQITEKAFEDISSQIDNNVSSDTNWTQLLGKNKQSIDTLITFSNKIEDLNDQDLVYYEGVPYFLSVKASKVILKALDVPNGDASSILSYLDYKEQEIQEKYDSIELPNTSAEEIINNKEYIKLFNRQLLLKEQLNHIIFIKGILSNMNSVTNMNIIVTTKN